MGLIIGLTVGNVICAVVRKDKNRWRDAFMLSFHQAFAVALAFYCYGL